MLKRLRSTIFALLAVLGVMPAVGVHAQGCVLCYTSLAAAGPKGFHAFEVAMFVLLAPALLLFLGLFLLIYRRRVTALPEPVKA
jgi:hypothetical protein